MIGGISLIGVLTGSLASWIVQRVSETDTANQAATALTIDQLRHEIWTLAEQLSATRSARERDHDNVDKVGVVD